MNVHAYNVMSVAANYDCLSVCLSACLAVCAYGCAAVKSKTEKADTSDWNKYIGEKGTRTHAKVKELKKTKKTVSKKEGCSLG